MYEMKFVGQSRWLETICINQVGIIYEYEVFFTYIALFIKLYIKGDM